jgi:hypothetical protein
VEDREGGKGRTIVGSKGDDEAEDGPEDLVHVFQFRVELGRLHARALEKGREGGREGGRGEMILCMSFSSV